MLRQCRAGAVVLVAISKAYRQ